MGCSASKPWKKTSGDVVGAYKWDERSCLCGTNEFKLVEEPPTDDDAANDFSQVKAVVEPQLSEVVSIIMENATRGCCCDSLNFEPAVKAVNANWTPRINASLESLGYSVDAFTWKEWQSNGQTSWEASFFVLRIKKLVDTVKEDA